MGDDNLMLPGGDTRPASAATQSRRGASGDDIVKAEELLREHARLQREIADMAGSLHSLREQVEDDASSREQPAKPWLARRGTAQARGPAPARTLPPWLARRGR
ncbi:hypothetical protein [Sphingomonas endophytica]|uniref:Uncharacterized protein n=1 Tax=Sphingomonas endophytica TaxID=869719 RepID=A0A147I7M2_9SPHN|nr:hypothetical protein [Sphingomonas endophytica]KTT74988.1 hypothetical protein NS334_03790 [Sphingomonas endophytica]